MKQIEDNLTTDLEDIFLYSDGFTWCYRYELHEMKHMSDDYEVIYFGTTKWCEFLDDRFWVK